MSGFNVPDVILNIGILLPFIEEFPVTNDEFLGISDEFLGICHELSGISDEFLGISDEFSGKPDEFFAAIDSRILGLQFVLYLVTIVKFTYSV